jgi:putative ABC transport system ATP-binding protein
MESTTSRVLLQAQGLCKTYGSGQSAVKALDDLSLNIYKGELLVILGSSGSGKSTLLNMLGGMDRPDKGTLRFRGKEISRLNDRGLTDYRYRNIGFIFQSFNLIAELTVRENVALTADLSQGADIVSRTLEMVGLSEKQDAYPSQLSGGQQQRTSIARALAGKSAMLLCDEPTGALDSQTGVRVLKLLISMARDMGKTIIIVTHNQNIAKMADVVVRVKNGQIIACEEQEHPLNVEEVDW